MLRSVAIITGTVRVEGPSSLVATIAPVLLTHVNSYGFDSFTKSISNGMPGNISLSVFLKTCRMSSMQYSVSHSHM